MISFTEYFLYVSFVILLLSLIPIYIKINFDNKIKFIDNQLNMFRNNYKEYKGHYEMLFHELMRNNITLKQYLCNHKTNNYTKKDIVNHLYNHFKYCTYKD